MATALMQNKMLQLIRAQQSTPLDQPSLDTPRPLPIQSRSSEPTPRSSSRNSPSNDYLDAKTIGLGSDLSSPATTPTVTTHPLLSDSPPHTPQRTPTSSSSRTPSKQGPPAAILQTPSSDSSSPSAVLRCPRTWPEASVQPDQQLTVTLFGARGLVVPPQRSGPVRPYAVLEFEQTESVTMDALGDLPNESLKQPPKWRGFKRGADGFKSPICAARSISPINARRPELSSAASDPHMPGSRLYSSSQSRSRTTSSSPEEPVWNHVATFDVLEPSPCIFISVYDRTAAETDINDEGFLGGTVIELDTGSIVANNATRVVLDEWIDLWDAAGEMRCGAVRARIEYGRTPVERHGRVGLSHFEVIKLIGEGSYGQVFRVRKKDTRRIYAMKVLDKQRILRDGKQTLQHVLAERQILIKTRSSPFLVGLKFSFQTVDALHLVMDLKSGGELMSYMQRYGGRFPEPWVVFYTAEILSGLSFLHSMDICYRDLKPENCLLDATGHVALCDFGLSKMDMKPDTSTRTFCGTTEYIAPEILMEEGYTRAVDFWALGVLIFEMSVGWTPFFSEDRVTKYSLILESDISAKIPKRGMSPLAREIILRLLERDPAQRLGSGMNEDEVKSHGFFQTIDWTALVSRRLRPPFRPRVESDAELSDRRGYMQASSTSTVPRSRRSSVDEGRDEFRNFTFSRTTSGSSLTALETELDGHNWVRPLNMFDDGGVGDRWEAPKVMAGGGGGGAYDRRSSENGYYLSIA